jgi:flagellar hook-associated protein 3 FlgL
MRITEGMLSDRYLKNYNKIAEQKQKLQTQLATNSKINTLSDDLIGALQSIKVEAQIKKTDTYIKNVQTANEFMTSSLDSLDNMTTEIQKIMKIVTSASNPLNVVNYPSMLQSIKDSLNAIVQDTNAKHNDMYLFGGTNYTTMPVTIDINGKAVITTEDVSGEVKVQLSQNVTDAINIPGNKIFGTGIFSAINNIIDSFEAGNAPDAALKTGLNDAYNQLLNVQTIGGEKLNRFEDISALLSNQQTNLTRTLANIQGIDVAKLAVDLQQQDYLLQISSKLFANIFPKSIYDYL